MKKNPFPISRYRNLSFNEEFVKALEAVCLMVFQEKQHADKAIGSVFLQQKEWREGLRGWFADIAYDIIRWKRLLVAYTGRPINRKIVEAFFELNEMEIKGENKGSEEKRLKPGKFTRADYLSLPDWLDEAGFSELGKDWEKEISAMNSSPAQVIRCNTLKTSRKTLSNALKKEGISARMPEEYPDALIIDEKKNLFKTDCFQKGWFEVQDASSQKVATYLDPKPGMRVIDACAGSGGKSLQLACIMKNKGKVLSLDTAEWRLATTEKRAKRAGAAIIETRLIKGTKTIKRLQNSADRLLLDVPCSGLGVLRRNPDIKWSLQPEYLNELKEKQSYILNFYSQMVKPGGLMVYSSCSILPSENEDHITAFLGSEKGSAFELTECINLRPSETGFDGFFIACFRRKDGN